MPGRNGKVFWVVLLLNFCLCSRCVWKRPMNVRIVRSDQNSVSYRVQVETPILTFQTAKGLQPPITVDLYSMLHVGEREYYDRIKSQLQSYDVVLYELITSKDNVDSGINPNKKRLTKEVVSPKTEAVAKRLQLTNQLSAWQIQDMTNWYIADLDSETVTRLENNNKERTSWRYWLSQIAGRTFSERLLSKFFLPDQGLLWLLRFLVWLTPCPELSCLAIDWARMSPKAGGLSPLLLVIVDLLLQNKPVEAAKLSFAQQLLAGIPDAGAYGGQAMSDTNTRVLLRNREVCRVLKQYMLEARLESRKDAVYKIAVLYGAYHVPDLCSRFTSKLNLDYVPTNSTLTAWKVDFSDVKADNAPSIVFGHVPVTQSSLIAIVAASMLYFFAGAVDWWVLLRFITETLEQSKTDEFLPWLTGLYSVNYVQRHSWLLGKISYVGVQWDRGLFEEVA